MADSYQIGTLFTLGVHTEPQVLSILQSATNLLMDGKTVMAWSSEGDSSTLQFTLPVDYVLKECRYFLKSINPAKYGYLVTSARQIRF